MTEENKDRPEYEQNVVVSKAFLSEIHAYLNEQPRNQTDHLCRGIEDKIPTVKAFLQSVDNYYEAEENNKDG